MQSTRLFSDTKMLNIFTSNLPKDPLNTRVPRQVRNACFSLCEIDSFPNVKLVSLSDSVMHMLGLEVKSPSDIEALFRNEDHPIRNTQHSYAMCYAGHQFGNWAGQLGDGRATTFGEIMTPSGRLVDVQVKGAGLTPYSRFADGKAVLRSSIREFLASEAMHAFGIGTTRALAVLESGQMVPRDKVYDGNRQDEKGALCIRTSPSFVRFGNFEMMRAQKKELTENLLNFEIKRNFTEILQKNIDQSGNEELKKINLGSNERFGDTRLDEFISEHKQTLYRQTLTRVCELTAEMVAGWEAVGFVHGVMNTDNMSILGLTIDYGPYGYMDFFDKKYTPNLSDHPGRRYAFQKQPHICLWNLTKLVSCFAESLGEKEELFEVIEKGFLERYNDARLQLFCDKLGLSRGEPETDKQMIEDLFSVLDLLELDYTRFFVSLEESFEYDQPESLVSALEQGLAKRVCEYICLKCFDFRENNIVMDDALCEAQACQSIAVGQGAKARQFSLSKKLEEELDNVLEQHSSKMTRLEELLRNYMGRLGKDQIANAERIAKMRKNNPLYALRNFALEEAIEAAESGDFGLVNLYLDIIRNPYTKHPQGRVLDRRRPSQVEGKFGAMFLSCSS